MKKTAAQRITEEVTNQISDNLEMSSRLTLDDLWPNAEIDGNGKRVQVLRYEPILEARHENS